MNWLKEILGERKVTVSLYIALPFIVWGLWAIKGEDFIRDMIREEIQVKLDAQEFYTIRQRDSINNIMKQKDWQISKLKKKLSTTTPTYDSTISTGGGK